MKLQMKIVLFFSVFTFVVSLLGGIFFYHSNIQQYEEMEKANLQVAAEQLMAQAENKIKQMEGCINYILSNPNILEAIRILGQKPLEENIYVWQAREAIRTGINTVFIYDSSYRTVVFNRSGEALASQNIQDTRIVSEPEIDQMPYLDAVDAEKGKNVILGAHRDTWGRKQQPQVFSVIKAVQGSNMGYIEVQKPVEELAAMQLPEKKMDYYIFLGGDELLCSSEGAPDRGAYYLSLFEHGDGVAKDGKSKQLVARYASQKYDLQVLVAGDLEKMQDNGNYTVTFTVSVTLFFFLLAVSFVVLISHIVTKPLHQLQKVVEHTELQNLGEQVQVKTAYDEIQALSDSYQAMRERLRTSMVNEKRLARLHIQAQFDALQAQVNPHFLYNVLNIISSRGVMDNDDSICEMCGCLANMLRYSTNNRERYAPIQREADYLKQYFYLLKMRYEHKLSIEMEFDQRVLQQTIPKLTLQQIVENSINHGLRNNTDVMEIEVRGWVEKDFWYVSVRDNGEGFSQEALAQLQERIEETRRMVLLDRDNMELEIGGMGLVNTYARCLILYQDSFQFELTNLDRGAEVRLGARMRPTGETNE